MFCPNCGNQIPDNSKFCGNCGSQIGNTSNYSYSPSDNEQLKFNLDTNSIVMLITSAVMLLSMLLLPMYQLQYTGHASKKYTIGLVGEIQMANIGMRDKLQNASRLAFVFLVAFLIAIVVFRMTQKYKQCLIASCLHLGTLIIHTINVFVTWTSDSSLSYEHSASLHGGAFICIACAILLVILTRKALNIKN